MEERKQAYEWVLIMSTGVEFALTEAQYEHYKANQEGGKLFFEDIEINPSFVSSAFKRRAESIKEKYPCRKCHTSGIFIEQSGEVQPNGAMPTTEIICPDCGGTGVDLP